MFLESRDFCNYLEAVLLGMTVLSVPAHKSPFQMAVYAMLLVDSAVTKSVMQIVGLGPAGQLGRYSIFCLEHCQNFRFRAVLSV